MTTVEIIVTVAAGALFLTLCVIGTVRIFKERARRAEEKSREVEDVTIKKGVRYTDDMTVVDRSGDMNISFGKKDIVLKQDVTYLSDPKDYLKPGKYVVLSTTGEDDSFNIRIGNYVREYKHNQKIIIPADTQVTCVSGSVILR